MGSVLRLPGQHRMQTQENWMRHIRFGLTISRTASGFGIVSAPNSIYRLIRSGKKSIESSASWSMRNILQKLRGKKLVKLARITSTTRWHQSCSKSSRGSNFKSPIVSDTITAHVHQDLCAVPLFSHVRPVGIEPTTLSLKGTCSTN